jgi:hypothetical protein
MKNKELIINKLNNKYNYTILDLWIENGLLSSGLRIPYNASILTLKINDEFIGYYNSNEKLPKIINGLLIRS